MESLSVAGITGRGRMSQHHEKLNRRAWALARFLCFDRDGFRCTECFRAGALEAHHLIPVSRGGRLYDVRIFPLNAAHVTCG